MERWLLISGMSIVDNLNYCVHAQKYILTQILDNQFQINYEHTQLNNSESVRY